ncbi:MAG: hypothetical protein ACR2RB_09115, partial [Gammaproteobacteria bacterium]
IIAAGELISVGMISFQRLRVFGDFFESGSILGGDTRYYISGTYSIENYGVTLDFGLNHYADDKHEALGPENAIPVSFSGTADSVVGRNVIEFQGRTVDTKEKLTLRLVRRARI